MLSIDANKAEQANRYAKKEGVEKYKRCIECDGAGHFKCREEKASQLVKLSFTVENDIDEFITAKGDGFAQGELSRRKRDLKKKQKK